MELDFDKEINALLRQAARSGELVSANAENHLDADEISAFAENALPEKTRKFYIKHFADCDRCRTILSNTILLNQEAETESASSAVAAPVAPEIVAAKVPWYRKMFVMPNLAYAMGGLVLIFGGMFSFSVLQNLNKSGVSDVSQMQKTEPARAGGPNADNDGAFYNSNSASAMSNTAAANNADTAMNSASSSSPGTSNSASANTSANVQSSPPVKAAGEISTADIAAEQRDQDAAKPTSDDSFQVDGTDKKAIARKDEKPADKNDEAEISQNDEPAKSTTAGAPPPAPKSMPAQPSINQRSAENLPLNGRRMESLPQTTSREKKREVSGLGATGNTRQVGGKTFNRVGGVWIDSAYNKSGGGNMALPRTKTIQRGSGQYRNLDKQVRIIAESLDGAVIIVWRDGAFRIQ